ncbi:MAG TPA: hypothetical protein VL974_01050 [Magnetospirillum sp.]|jgi:hypothetical protein|nr:hypothetical protein [Magnetospirillum sp.]
MIDALSTITPATPKTTGMNTAALDAARKADERQQQQAAELDAIRSKGFSAWVRDTQVEALKEKLRKQVMAEMGVDADQLNRMTAAMRQILEQKIEQEVEKRVQEEEAKRQDKDQKVAHAAKQPQAKNDQDGKTCPVIPALAWPGAASLF